MNERLVSRLAPAVFVLLWSTGFIVARYATRDANALSFLTVRTVVATVVLFGLAAVVREPRVGGRAIGVQAMVGFGMHAMYLGGVFLAIGRGLPSSISALIAALHPVVTPFLARVVLREPLSGRQMAGMGLGFVGVLAVVIEHGGASHGVTPFGLTAMAVAVVGMSAGTLVQRRHGAGTPLLGGTAWQYLTTSIVLGAAAVIGQGWRFEPTARTLWSLAWAVGVLSIAAVLIMLWLLHRHATARVSSLFFLTPALSTLEAAILFGERLGALSVAGLIVAIAGVGLATTASSNA